jgi:hypothetical protein
MYIDCKRWSTPQHRVLPWSGAWEDWDAEECLAWQLIEELVERQERRKTILDASRRAGPGGLVGRPGGPHPGGTRPPPGPVIGGPAPGPGFGPPQITTARR